MQLRHSPSERYPGPTRRSALDIRCCQRDLDATVRVLSGRFVWAHTVIRCTPNRREIETTLSPFARAVWIESTSLSVSGVLVRLLGVLTRGSPSPASSSSSPRPRFARSHAEPRRSKRCQVFGLSPTAFTLWPGAGGPEGIATERPQQRTPADTMVCCAVSGDGPRGHLDSRIRGSGGSGVRPLAVLEFKPWQFWSSPSGSSGVSMYDP